MRCFTFKSLKSLKAPGLDGFDFGLLNLQCVCEEKRKKRERLCYQYYLTFYWPNALIEKGSWCLNEDPHILYSSSEAKAY